MSTPKNVVAICTPLGPNLSPHFKWCQEAMVSRMPPSKVTTHKLEVTDIHSVEDARRRLTEAALQVVGLTHAIFIDDDMLYQPDAVNRLLDKMEQNPHFGAIGGLCFNRRNPYMPVIARAQPDYLGLGPDAVGWVYDYPPDTVFEVDRTGAAFLLIKADMLKAMAEKYGIEHVWESTPTEGEDILFCRKARSDGFRIAVDTGCKVGHMAKVIVDEDFARRNRSHEWQAWQGEFENVKKEGKPLVSVVIPVFNQAKRILNAAVHSALAQTLRVVEVIVVDDGSEPPVKTVEDPRVKVIRHEKNRGIAAALNTGIAAMTTDWFAWLSSDDLFYPEKIEKQLASVQQRDALASCHHYDCLGSDDDPLKSRPILCPCPTTQIDQRKLLVEGCWVNGSTCMLHKSLLEKVRLANGDWFDTSFRYSQDWDMWCRIAQVTKWHLLDSVQGARRTNGDLTAEVQKDPEKMRLWQREDARVKDAYALKRCECCGQWV